MEGDLSSGRHSTPSRTVQDERRRHEKSWYKTRAETARMTIDRDHPQDSRVAFVAAEFLTQMDRHKQVEGVLMTVGNDSGVFANAENSSNISCQMGRVTRSTMR